MTYLEALEYLNSLINYEKRDDYDYKRSFKLSRVERLASLLGDPHKGIRSVHIAGTKGKGSTAAFIHSILKKAGFRSGLYTSPHLISLRERIRINDDLIAEEDVSRLTEKVRAAADRMQDDKPSFFEVCTNIAYLYFKERGVDFGVYEVGLGGRLDATNIIDPLVSVITPVSYDHTQILGRTLKEIAAEKAGIIKEESVCVSAPQEAEALEVIKEACEKKRAGLILVGKDMVFEELGFDGDRECFSVFGTVSEYPFLRTGLLGSHQVVNATTAIGAIEVLRMKGAEIDSGAIREGVEETRWPGRIEVAGRRPLVVLDGAHNRASANALANAVKRLFRYRRLFLVLGVSKDKDVDGILEELLPVSDSVVLTRSKIGMRALDPVKLKETVGSGGKGPNSKDVDLTLTSDVGEALKMAASMADEEDMILITGSLFVVGEARAVIRGEKEI